MTGRSWSSWKRRKCCSTTSATLRRNQSLSPPTQSCEWSLIAQSVGIAEGGVPQCPGCCCVCSCCCVCGCVLACMHAACALRVPLCYRDAQQARRGAALVVSAAAVAVFAVFAVFPIAIAAVADVGCRWLLLVMMWLLLLRLLLPSRRFVCLRRRRYRPQSTVELPGDEDQVRGLLLQDIGGGRVGSSLLGWSVAVVCGVLLVAV
jgi:hypothetical protein